MTWILLQGHLHVSCILPTICLRAAMALECKGLYVAVDTFSTCCPCTICQTLSWCAVTVVQSVWVWLCKWNRWALVQFKYFIIKIIKTINKINKKIILTKPLLQQQQQQVTQHTLRTHLIPGILLLHVTYSSCRGHSKEVVFPCICPDCWLGKRTPMLAQITDKLESCCLWSNSGYST